MPAATNSVVYQTVVAKARELARDLLRTRNIHALIREKAALDLDVTQGEAEIKAFTEVAEKNLARAEYQLSKVDQADPDAEMLTKELTKTRDRAKEVLEHHLEQSAKSLAVLKKKVADRKEELDAKIARWESGENKVQLENLNEHAHRFIEIYYDDLAKDLA